MVRSLGAISTEGIKVDLVEPQLITMLYVNTTDPWISLCLWFFVLPSGLSYNNTLVWVHLAYTAKGATTQTELMEPSDLGVSGSKLCTEQTSSLIKYPASGILWERQKILIQLLMQVCILMISVFSISLFLNFYKHASFYCEIRECYIFYNITQNI